MSLHVTNIPGTFESGKGSTGFYMDGYLAHNLLGIPAYLDKKWDVVGIISGHGKVRVGKSTIAFQVASFIAWLLAGGKIDMELIKDEYGKSGWRINKIKNPTKPIKFSLKENVVFSAMDLKNTATTLYDKYGRSQPILYDEGREGLEGARAMENLNKVMQDFFQECGYMGHVILIVLPNYFKLHEDYSVSRSLFLIDAFHDKYKRRGYFNFYNEIDKEWLYFLGKKRIGITQKYKSHRETFWGRFTSWFPFDRVEYEKLKAEALKKRAKTRRESEYKNHRDAMIYLLYETGKYSYKDIAELVTKLTGNEISHETAFRAVEYYSKKQIKVEEDKDKQKKMPKNTKETLEI